MVRAGPPLVSPPGVPARDRRDRSARRPRRHPAGIDRRPEDDGLTPALPATHPGPRRPPDPRATAAANRTPAADRGRSTTRDAAPTVTTVTFRLSGSVRDEGAEHESPRDGHRRALCSRRVLGDPGGPPPGHRSALASGSAPGTVRT